jgi:3-oxoacyl-(acyl-carrier-protein) synthase
MSEPVWVTGMAINTPLSDALEGTLEALLAGRSAITSWRSLDVARCYSKIGADLGDYPVVARAETLYPRIPEKVALRLQKLLRRVPWSVQLGLLLAAEAVAEAGLTEEEAALCPVVVGGHNLSSGYGEAGFSRFSADPGSVEVGQELYGLDTTQAACVSELLGSHRPTYTVGGACASGNLALLAGLREIRHHDAPRVLVLGALAEPSAVSLHAFALLGALSIESFNDQPERASRPWDQRREGFVPAHGGGAIILESAALARRRGRMGHAELCSVAVCSDASHLTAPDEEGQARAITLALRRAGMAAEEVDYVGAHATSTPMGDLVELRAIRRALGAQADKIKINASKSMLGHSFSAAAIVEGIAGILQMKAGMLHGTRNIDQLDPAVDLDVCSRGPCRWPVRSFLNNAFGFGGINAVSLFRAVQP